MSISVGGADAPPKALLTYVKYRCAKLNLVPSKRTVQLLGVRVENLGTSTRLLWVFLERSDSLAVVRRLQLTRQNIFLAAFAAAPDTWRITRAPHI